MYQLFNVMNCRSQKSIFSLGVFSNRAINIAFLVSFSLLLFFVQLADVSIPFTGIEIGGLLSTMLSLTDWMIITAVAFLFLIEEFRKFIVNSSYLLLRNTLGFTYIFEVWLQPQYMTIGHLPLNWRV